MGAVAEPDDLTKPERRVLFELRLDGTPVGLIPRGHGCQTQRVAGQLRARGFIGLWPGRGWYLTDAGHRMRARLFEDA